MQFSAKQHNAGFSAIGVLISLSIFGALVLFLAGQTNNMENSIEKMRTSADLLDIKHLVHENFSCKKTLEQVNCNIDSKFQDVYTYQDNGVKLTDILGSRFEEYEVKAECNGMHFDFFHRKYSDKDKIPWKHLFNSIPIICKEVLIPEGLTKGHFDADTFAGKKLLKHVHAYDDKNSTNGIVYYGPSNQAKGKLSLLGSKKISANTIFTISLENSSFSKGGRLKINANYYNWSKLPPKKTYSISNPAADELITELSVEYNINSIVNGLIVCGDPKKVKGDPTNRSRTLVVKLKHPIDNSPLWEGVTYWHDKDCKI